MSYKGLRLDVDADGVAMVTMCNGDNMFTMDYVKEWNNVLNDIDRNESITAMITTAEGRAFSTGLDVRWLQKQSPETLDQYHDALHGLYKRILSLGIPTVAAINGHAIAEGAFIALVHDYRVMRADRGWIIWPEVHMKLPFTKTMLDIFRVKVPNGIAHREALVFGKRLDASTAHRLGIVDHVAPEDKLLAAARTSLAEILAKWKVSRGLLNDIKDDLYNALVTNEQLSKSKL